MTQAEALHLDSVLQSFKELRENLAFKSCFLPEIERQRNEAHVGMRDRKLSQAERCEHVTGFDNADTLLKFIDKQEATIRASLRAFDATTPIIERSFSERPIR
jgi:hypothetical protein